MQTSAKRGKKWSVEVIIYWRIYQRKTQLSLPFFAALIYLGQKKNVLLLAVYKWDAFEPLGVAKRIDHFKQQQSNWSVQTSAKRGKKWSVEVIIYWRIYQRKPQLSLPFFAELLFRTKKKCFASYSL